MRILFFSSIFPNGLQPTHGVFNLRMIQGLMAKHDIRVVSPVSWVTELGKCIRERSYIRKMDYSVTGNLHATYPRYLYPPKLFRTKYDRFMKFSVIRSLKRISKEFKPDVILSYWTHPDSAVAVEFAHQLGIPAVAMVGGSDVLLLGKRGKRRESILNVLHDADRVLTVSKDLANCIKRDGVNPSKVDVVYRGVNTSKFKPGNQLKEKSALGLSSKYHIAMQVGRLVTLKGHTDFITACNILYQRGEPIKGYIVGGGPLYHKLQAQITSHRLDNVVHLVGPVPHQRLVKWYQAADSVVLPSHSEGVPNVLLEAIACGKAFIASNVGGIPEIADPDIDILVPPSNAAELANAMSQFVHHPPSTSDRRFRPKGIIDTAIEISDVLQKAIDQYQSQLANLNIHKLNTAANDRNGSEVSNQNPELNKDQNKPDEASAQTELSHDIFTPIATDTKYNPTEPTTEDSTPSESETSAIETGLASQLIVPDADLDSESDSLETDEDPEQYIPLSFH